MCVQTVTGASQPSACSLVPFFKSSSAVVVIYCHSKVFMIQDTRLYNLLSYRVYFTVYMLLLQDTHPVPLASMSLTARLRPLSHSWRLSYLFSETLSFFYLFIYDSPTCFSYKVAYKSICTNRHTNTNETFRLERSKGDITTWLSQYRTDTNEAVWHIKHSLLGNALGKDGGLGAPVLHLLWVHALAPLTPAALRSSYPWYIHRRYNQPVGPSETFREHVPINCEWLN
jgi:hypothetical protein